MSVFELSVSIIIPNRNKVENIAPLRLRFLSRPTLGVIEFLLHFVIVAVAESKLSFGLALRFLFAMDICRLPPGAHANYVEDCDLKKLGLLP
jgi:hypothetical protein